MNRLQAFYSRLWITVVVGLLALAGGFVLAQARIARADQSINLAQGDAVTAAKVEETIGTQSLTIPDAFNYQGILRDTQGALINGSVNIAAKIYDLPTGGSILHSESFIDVPVRQGLFNIVLGDQPGGIEGALDGAPRYIGITLNGGAEIIPRERVHSVPWAIHATHAKSADTSIQSDFTKAFTGVKIEGFAADASASNSTVSTPLPASTFSKGVTCFISSFQVSQAGAAASCVIDQGGDGLKAGPHNTCIAACVTWYGAEE